MCVTTKKVVLFSVLSLFINAAVCNMSEAAGKPEVKVPEATAPQGSGQVEPIAAAEKKVEVTDASFRCLHKMTKVGNMYVDNLLGDLEGTLAVAKSSAGGVYPAGSVVQLLPTEVMIKREKGANDETNDWEFFVLEVSPEGSKIKQRGFNPPVKNMLGSCISCHKQVAPQADMVCAAGQGCPPIVFPGGIDNAKLISALQKTDKRCPSPEPPTPEEMAELIKLKKMLEAQAAAAAAAAGQP
ncbi:MAG: hypothetical protein CDV28_11815 [Candidatus Electronema aureum]|uniref:Cytochrome P460 n=1 Tax=Candidatus Electronema aureum TaxID=2005002 RepID=A0A521G1K2_9BACT|nr:MAG: hypothetical protein CDV28_11815 [Candidatus Electronema aureum]